MAITWLKMFQISQVGGVLESSGPPLHDGLRDIWIWCSLGWEMNKNGSAILISANCRLVMSKLENHHLVCFRDQNRMFCVFSTWQYLYYYVSTLHGAGAAKLSLAVRREKLSVLSKMYHPLLILDGKCYSTVTQLVNRGKVLHKLHIQ